MNPGAWIACASRQVRKTQPRGQRASATEHERAQGYDAHPWHGKPEESKEYWKSPNGTAECHSPLNWLNRSLRVTADGAHLVLEQHQCPIEAPPAPCARVGSEAVRCPYHSLHGLVMLLGPADLLRKIREAGWMDERAARFDIVRTHTWE